MGRASLSLSCGCRVFGVASAVCPDGGEFLVTWLSLDRTGFLPIFAAARPRGYDRCARARRLVSHWPLAQFLAQGYKAIRRATL